MKKRADGRYTVSISYKDIDGIPHRKSIYGTSKKEVKEKEFEFRRKLGLKIDISAERDTFKQWLDTYLEDIRDNVCDSWYKSKICSSKHLETLFYRQITDIRTIEMTMLLRELSMREKPLSRKSLSEIKSLLSCVFETAIESRVLEYNPAKSIKLPKDNRTERPEDRRALTETERQWIIDTPHRCQIAAMIMMFAGLRKSELIPLLTTDINLDDSTITISKSVEYINDKPQVKPGGKTASAVRVIYMPKILTEYLRSNMPAEGLICPSASGKMQTKTAFRRLWNSYISVLNYKYGDFSGIANYNKPNSRFAPEKIPQVIPKITAHWLRHTFASMLYMAGVDVMTARDQLGHSDIKTTLAIYTHLDKTHKIKNISKLNNYLECV